MKIDQKLEFAFARNVAALQKHPNPPKHRSGTLSLTTCLENFKPFQSDSNRFKAIQSEKTDPHREKPRQPFSLCLVDAALRASAASALTVFLLPWKFHLRSRTLSAGK